MFRLCYLDLICGAWTSLQAEISTKGIGHMLTN